MYAGQEPGKDREEPLMMKKRALTERKGNGIIRLPAAGVARRPGGIEAPYRIDRFALTDRKGNAAENVGNGNGL